MINQIKSVELNHRYQIRITLAKSSQKYIIDFTKYLSYPAYSRLNELSIFLNAKFDDDIIFWGLDIDIHIDQLLELIKSPILEIKNNDRWIKLKKISYYNYAVQNWSFA